ncbi:MAG: sulfurtransferase [Pseudomonadales bacterium]|nr:sulfurtransferase [Pseudomonadales bacterium]
MTDPLGLIITPQELHSILPQTQSSTPSDRNPELLILDLSQPQSYGKTHVPGAIHLPFSHLNRGIKPAVGELPSIELLEQLFSQVGLTPDKHVVAYDDEGGGWAGRLIWMLDMIGHQHYSYLDGGIHAWLGDKLPTEQAPNFAKATQVSITLNDQPRVDKAFILEHLQDPNMVIWDARSKEEYLGLRVVARRGGHIPGAQHYEWTTAMDKDNQLRIRDLTKIRQELTEKGITKDKLIVTHCQTHHRSGFTYLLGKALGFENIKAYPGSWSEWGNDEKTPIECDG